MIEGALLFLHDLRNAAEQGDERLRLRHGGAARPGDREGGALHARRFGGRIARKGHRRVDRGGQCPSRA